MITEKDTIKCESIFNEERTHRYLWKRVWDKDKPLISVIMLNPSQADNIITVAWTGTICTNPPMAYISVRPERHSYDMIKNSGEFVINLTTKDLVKAVDSIRTQTEDVFIPLLFISLLYLLLSWMIGKIFHLLYVKFFYYD